MEKAIPGQAISEKRGICSIEMPGGISEPCPKQTTTDNTDRQTSKVEPLCALYPCDPCYPWWPLLEQQRRHFGQVFPPDPPGVGSFARMPDVLDLFCLQLRAEPLAAGKQPILPTAANPEQFQPLVRLAGVDLGQHRRGIAAAHAERAHVGERVQVAH